MAELMEVPFGVWPQLGPRNHASDGDVVPSTEEWGNFGGSMQPHACITRVTCYYCYLSSGASVINDFVP